MNELEELRERNRMLSDIALSAIALKLNIEHGFPPTLHALNRDLAAYQAKFKSAFPVENGDLAQAAEHSLDKRAVGASSTPVATKSDGPVAMNAKCPKCGSTQFEMRNYEMMWHEGDIHCANCGIFIRRFDAG